MKRLNSCLLILIISSCCLFTSCITDTSQSTEETKTYNNKFIEYDANNNGKYDDIPVYDGNEFTIINDGNPYFDLDTIDGLDNSFEYYSDLDNLNRCGKCYANIGKDLMPKSGEKRQSISSIYPTGWKYNGKSNNNKYDTISGKYIYNRCHLIGWQLTAENANQKNLVTGTRQMNMAMLKFENLVADYIKGSSKIVHVYYVITPVFISDELLCRGIILEAESVEDFGESILFCAFIYNNQDGICIDYETGYNYMN